MLATNQIVYPDSDGQPMADNTKQFRWITIVKSNLDWLFQDEELVFVAGDLLWYPVEGNPKYRVAPDAMVVFGRPKGDRGSYKQWQEDNIPPQVVFEILSPGNTEAEMERKLQIYARCGVEEYYIYDPDRYMLKGYQRGDDFYLDRIEVMDGWTSPRLGIGFQMIGEELQITHPDGRIFESFDRVATERDLILVDKQQLEIDKQQLAIDKQQLEDEKQQLEDEKQQLEDEKQQLEIEKSKRDAKLRELGIDPNLL